MIVWKLNRRRMMKKSKTHYVLIVLGFIFMLLCIIMLIGTLYAGWYLEHGVVSW